jgi:uroporphyrinogen-III synthase
VLLTQGRGRLEALETALRARGDEVVRRPLIRVAPRNDVTTRSAARRLLRHPWMLFASRSAVEAWVTLGLPLPVPPHGPRLGAVGAGTAAALRRAGGRVELVADPERAEGLAAAFLAQDDVRGPVGLPRGDRSRDTLERLLVQAGVSVDPLVLYETRPETWQGDADADAIVVASPSAAAGLPVDPAPRAAIVAIGPVTGAALRERGLPAWIAERPDAHAILERLDAAHAAGGSDA